MPKLVEYVLAARWYAKVFKAPPGIAKPQPQLFGVDPGSYSLSNVKAAPLTMASLKRALQRWP